MQAGRSNFFNTHAGTRILMGLTILPFLQGIPPIITLLLYNKVRNLEDLYNLYIIISLTLVVMMLPFNILYTLTLEYFSSKIFNDLLFIAFGGFIAILFVFAFIIAIIYSTVYLIFYTLFLEIILNVKFKEGYKLLLLFAMGSGVMFSLIFRLHYNKYSSGK